MPRVQRKLLESGQVAPEFELAGLDGKTHTLNNVLKEGPAVLVFYKNTCPVCQYALPFLERLYQSPSKGDARVFGVSQDGARDTKEFAGEFGLSFPMLMDESSKGYPASNEYGISHVPSIFLVETNGKVAMGWDGFSKADMESLGRRLSTEIFRPNEDVPSWKAG